MKYAFISVALGLALTGCASMMDQPALQTVSVTSDPAGAHCVLTNPRGRWEVTTPGQVTLIPSSGGLLLSPEMEVTCTKGSLKGTDTFAATLSGWGYGSAILGGPAIGKDGDRAVRYRNHIHITLE